MKRDERNDQRDTDSAWAVKITRSEARATLTAGASKEVGTLPRAYFVVIDGDSSSIRHLTEDAALTIGRDPDCDILLASSDVSRRHAELRRTRYGATLLDLGSRHGTLVNDERVERDTARALCTGDRIHVGSAQLVFHCDAAPMRAYKAPTPAALHARIREEVQRAMFYQRELAVLSFVARGAAQATDIAPLIEPHLRVIDVWGQSAKGDVTVVLPDSDRKRASALAEALRSALKGHLSSLRCGVACCPADGCDADTLSAIARHNAEQGARGVTDSKPNVLAVGDRFVVVADPTMESVYNLIRRLAKSALPVLINGETGVGKEIAASAIHEWSTRKDAPFLALNCAALPTELAESALFGHERGAFTGAASQKLGIFESADTGTVFLDELGELPLAVQAKLLRVLDSQRVTRLGDVVERPVNVRLIAATNRDLAQEMREGRFREDLFFRLSTARVVLPPLRDRPRDLGGLATQLLAEACTRSERGPLELSASAKIALHSHSWPGNIRELKNAMNYVAATVESDATTVEAWHLPGDIARPERVPAQEREPQVAPAEPAVRSATGFRPVSEELRELEARRMREALEATGYVQIEAARLISMPMRTFATKVKRYGLLPGRGAS